MKTFQDRIRKQQIDSIKIVVWSIIAMILTGVFYGVCRLINWLINTINTAL